MNRRRFLQKAGVGALQLGLVSYFANYAVADALKINQLPRSLPELQGVKSSGIMDFVQAVESKKLNVHSLMVLRNGKVLAEGWWAPYRADLKHTLYSLSKSFTSTAIGLAIDEGKLGLTDPVISFFSDQLPAEISENLKKMKVQDLLTMRTGHAADSITSLVKLDDPNWIKSFLALPVEHEPGTFFVYNSGATYMLSAILQKLTGQTLLQYLKPRLFEPLGIEGIDWEVDPNGINTGGWGLRLKTEDIARFGQLYLQKGVWRGKTLLSENWIAEATKAQVPARDEESDWAQGYGYQFWRCRHDAYRGDGAFGQYCIVMPKQNMVIAITSETNDMGAIQEQIWKCILPVVLDEAVPALKSEQFKLKEKLSTLALPIPFVKNKAREEADMEGKKFTIEANDLKVRWVSLEGKGNSYTFRMEDDTGLHQVVCGLGKWKEGFTDLSTLPLKLAPTPVPGETKTKIAASGTWIDGQTFEMTWRFIETAHYQTVTCSFEGDSIQVAFKRSMGILANTVDPRPVLKGKWIS